MGERVVEVPDEPQVPAELLLERVRASRDSLAYQVDFLTTRNQVLEQQIASLLEEKSDG